MFLVITGKHKIWTNKHERYDFSTNDQTQYIRAFGFPGRQSEWMSLAASWLFEGTISTILGKGIYNGLTIVDFKSRFPHSRCIDWSTSCPTKRSWEHVGTMHLYFIHNYICNNIIYIDINRQVASWHRLSLALGHSTCAGFVPIDAHLWLNARLDAWLFLDVGRGFGWVHVQLLDVCIIQAGKWHDEVDRSGLVAPWNASTTWTDRPKPN